MTEAKAGEERGAFSIREFARWAGIGRTAVYEEIGSGRLAALKCGKRTIISMEAAIRWRDSLPTFLEERSQQRNPRAKATALAAGDSR